MDMYSVLSKAIVIADNAHKEQKCKDGSPYITHPLHIKNSVEEIEVKIVAVLHDVIEDCNIDSKYLIESGIPEEIVEIIVILTKNKNEAYMDYIYKISKNRIATIVKIADLEHNMDLTRLKKLSQKDLIRLTKYHDAWKYLKDKLGEHNKRNRKNVGGLIYV